MCCCLYFQRVSPASLFTSSPCSSYRWKINLIGIGNCLKNTCFPRLPPGPVDQKGKRSDPEAQPQRSAPGGPGGPSPRRRSGRVDQPQFGGGAQLCFHQRRHGGESTFGRACLVSRMLQQANRSAEENHPSEKHKSTLHLYTYAAAAGHGLRAFQYGSG